MNPSDPDVAEAIARSGHVRSIKRVTTFKGDVDRPDGTSAQATIEVWDYGPGVARWQVWAKDEDGRVTLGGPADDLQVAIAATRWWGVDR